MVDPLPKPLIAPAIEVTLDRRARWAVIRQHPPLAAGAEHEQDAIEHLAEINLARSTEAAWRRQQRADDGPLRIRRIACIAKSPAPILRTGDFGPRRGASVVARNPTESQPTEIT